MYRCVYSGFDSLDVSYQGALPAETLAYLREAKEEARQNKRDQLVAFGPGPFKGLIKGHGMSGGYSFVLTNGPTGAIFSVMDNEYTRNWNLAVSVRALRLLTHGYQATRQWIGEMFNAMGCELINHSVRRIDFAVDVQAPGFELHMDNFVAPGRAKIMPYWSDEQLIDNDGNRPMAVVRGRTFESVTIGKMPGRQITTYDKTRACIDQNQPYWHEAWGLDKNDPLSKVVRVEVRAGRDAMAKRLLRRSYDAVEADIEAFIEKALNEVRYVFDKGQHQNISRASTHEIWAIAQKAASEIAFDPTPVIPEARALELMRRQRVDMTLKQGFGCLVNSAILSGVSPFDIASNFEGSMNDLAHTYVHDIGCAKILQKAEQIQLRAEPFIRRFS